MEELLWKVIEESKSGKEYLTSKKQYENLESILSTYDKQTKQSMHDTIFKIKKQLINQEFENLHLQDGGIVNAGDDGFYMDFAYWLIAQGESLYKEFQRRGHQAVLDYIKKHKIPEKDYLFECMVYAFQG